MNVSKTAQQLLMLLMLLLPLGISAQVVTTHNGYEGEALSLYTSSVIATPVITTPPSNGTAYFQSTGTSEGTAGNDVVIYTPNAGFTGEDSFEVYRWSEVATPQTLTFVITVSKSIVTAADDYISTSLGEPISAFVLENDTRTNGNLSVREILVENNTGQVSIDLGGSITYTPPAGFTGIANLNYLVCNEVNACDCATLSIAVEEANPVSETLQLITTRNSAKDILLALDGYSLITVPTKGFIDDSEDVLKYRPYGTDLGSDIFVYKKGEVTKTVEVDILDADDTNFYAKDDYIYTAVGKAIEIPFLDNDLSSDIYQDVRITQQPTFGTLTLDEEQNQVIYQPQAGFSTSNPFTIDRFVYEVSVDGTTESATVYIYVNDFLPSASSFDLSTPKNIPLAIQYAIPIDYSGFEILSQGTLGTVSFHQNLDTEVGGRRFVGEQVLLYTPNEGAVGTDQFEVQYCLEEGNCKSLTINMEVKDLEIAEENICLGGDCVWSGDANNDGVVDMNDLLTVGRFIGQTGKPRIQPTIDEWYGQYSDKWLVSESVITVNIDLFVQESVITVNIDLFGQHIDTNGDGVISAKDTTAISKFFGNYHAITPTPMPDKDLLPIYYGKPDTVPVAGPGAILQIPIILGSEFYAAEDIYGLTFDINYSSDVFVPGSAKVEFLDDSWLAYGSPTLSMSKTPYDGNVQVGFTRTDGETASGYGAVAMFSIVTTVNIDLFRTAEQIIEPLSITASIMNGQGVTKQLDADTYQLRLMAEEESDSPLKLDDESRLIVYPNPASEVLNLHLNELKEIDRYELFNLTGQLLKTESTSMPIEVRGLNNGLYLLKVYTTDGGILNKKFEVLKN